jgi:hypothetical protein
MFQISLRYIGATRSELRSRGESNLLWAYQFNYTPPRF